MSIRRALLGIWVARRVEAAIQFVAWHLPRTLAMWAFVRVATAATSGKYGTDDPSRVSLMEALRRWEGD